MEYAALASFAFFPLLAFLSNYSLSDKRNEIQRESL
jgi:hypothetical protein